MIRVVTAGALGKLRAIPVLLGLAALLPQAWAAQVALTGRVVDENGSPVHDARVTVHGTGPAARAFEAQTDPTGAFTLSLPEPGDYLYSVDREGYYALRDHPIHVAAPSQELTATINTVREVFQSVNVAEETSPVELAATSHEEQLSGTEINDIPYANSHSLLNSLHLLPEITQDSAGSPHLNGSSQSQVLYLLNGFNLANPISGQFQTALAVEGIRSVDVSSGRYSPEYGKGSAGVIAINTANGTDKYHFTATDFIPGLSTQGGLRLGNWYPRFGVSGPILRGRAWFSDSASFEYTQSVVSGLPKNQNTRSGLLASNLAHTQFHLSSSNILFADFLINVDNEGRVGLSPLSPVSTTSSVDTRQYFGSVKDQISFSRGALIEFGYAHNLFSVTQTPQGQALYVFSAQGNSGNYFVNGQQTASRDEGLTHAYLPRFRFLGEHHIESGADADLLRYSGDFHRTGYSVLGFSGQLLSQTLFGPPASFTVHDADAAWWVLDTWHATKSLQFTPGARWDWDQRIGRSAWSPRVAFSWSPFHTDRTRVSGGYAITRDAATMDLFGYPYDQVATTTTYGLNGIGTGPAIPTRFTTANSHLVMPRDDNWNLDLDHQLSARILLSARYLRRRGSDELIYANAADPYAPPSLLPLPAGKSAGAYQLTNLRRGDFDSVRLSIRQRLSGQYEWMVAYTRSRAVSNALIDPASPEPLQVLGYLAPIPWDAPNRLLGSAYLPLPWKNWAFSLLSDMRSGYPYSARDQYGLVQGAVNSYRYPLNFDLNLAIERMVTFHGRRFALRGGVNNLTNQLNATAVNNVVGPGFQKLLSGEGRHFVVRIRFFGAAENQPGGGPIAKPTTKPPQAPAPETEYDESRPLPGASIYGNTGLWKVFTADTLAPRQAVVSTWYDRINRNPGDLVVSTLGFGGAIGITSRIELGVSFEANRDVTTGRPDELSFGQQALGYFGAKTPGSKPLVSELVAGSSTVPQLRYPASPYGALTGAAGYYDLYPFAGQAPSGSAAGDLLFGLKIRILSESKGAAFGLAIRPYFDLPIHKAITFLETHPVGTADLQGGFDGIVSRSIGGIAELSLNAGYRYVSQPAHVSVFHLSEDVPLGFGVTIPRSARIQFVAESTADVFVGAHTPNTTFGPQDPVDLTVGFRGSFARKFSFSAGYRRPVNQFGGDKNGFVMSLGFEARRGRSSAQN
jgi:Carboxypeptidase regulatory-like domain/TonB-dependent Receptor Plug Domain